MKRPRRTPWFAPAWALRALPSPPWQRRVSRPWGCCGPCDAWRNPWLFCMGSMEKYGKSPTIWGKYGKSMFFFWKSPIIWGKYGELMGKIWKTYGETHDTYGKMIGTYIENTGNIWGKNGKHVGKYGKIWENYGKHMGKIGETYGENMEHIFGTMIFDLLYRDVVIVGTLVIGKAFTDVGGTWKLMGNIWILWEKCEKRVGKIGKIGETYGEHMETYRTKMETCIHENDGNIWWKHGGHMGKWWN